MKFNSIRLLDPIHIDKMWRMYKIEDGLIVEEVYSVYCYLFSQLLLV